MNSIAMSNSGSPTSKRPSATLNTNTFVAVSYVWVIPGGNVVGTTNVICGGSVDDMDTFMALSFPPFSKLKLNPITSPGFEGFPPLI